MLIVLYRQSGKEIDHARRAIPADKIKTGSKED